MIRGWRSLFLSVGRCLRGAIAAVNVDGWFSARAGRQPAEQLAIAHDELRATGVVISLRTALPLTPGRGSSDLEMLSFGNAARHRVHPGGAYFIASPGSATGLAAFSFISNGLRPFLSGIVLLLSAHDDLAASSTESLSSISNGALLALRCAAILCAMWGAAR